MAGTEVWIRQRLVDQALYLKSMSNDVGFYLTHIPFCLLRHGLAHLLPCLVLDSADYLVQTAGEHCPR